MALVSIRISPNSHFLSSPSPNMTPTTLSIILFSLSASSVFAVCPSNGGSMSFLGACSATTIQAQGCDLTSSGFSAAQVETACDAAASSFGASTDKYYQHDKAFMDGGSSFNDDRVTKMTVDAGRVMRFRSVVNKTRVLWPQYKALEAYVPADQKPYMSNFNLTSSCALRAAMCCFTESRSTTLLQDNTDICHHDFASSRRSNHVYNGFGVYNSSSPAYCVAFAWAADKNSPSNRYKGNALFDVAFGTFLDKGFVRNVPGAPLCGCVEQMPTVTKAACRTVTVNNEGYTLKITTNKDLLITQTTGTVTFSDCGNFTTFYSTISTVAEQTKLKAKITTATSCTDTKKNFLNERFYVPGTALQFTKANTTLWEHVAGEGQAFKPTKTFDKVARNNLFMAVFNKSPNKIVMRQCHSCIESHQFIYYRRLTPVPASLNLLDLFLDNWSAEGSNIIGKDFKLFSTYQNALDQKGNWTYCQNSQPGIGFPHDCGPTTSVGSQWNSISNGPWSDDYNGVSYGFYIEKSLVAK